MTLRLRPARCLLWLLALVLAKSLPAQVPDPGPGSPWVLAPPFFPRGALITLVDGDPNAPGPLQVELIFPQGYRIAPHFHAADLLVTVKAGALEVGVGDRVRWREVRTLSPGDTATVPRGVPYYYRTVGQTRIAARTTGPFVLTYVRPEDDPSRARPFGQ